MKCPEVDPQRVVAVLQALLQAATRAAEADGLELAFVEVVLSEACGLNAQHRHYYRAYSPLPKELEEVEELPN